MSSAADLPLDAAELRQRQTREAASPELKATAPGNNVHFSEAEEPAIKDLSDDKGKKTFGRTPNGTSKQNPSKPGEPRRSLVRCG